MRLLRITLKKNIFIVFDKSVYPDQLASDEAS